jgi:hypothetical protein
MNKEFLSYWAIVVVLMIACACGCSSTRSSVTPRIPTQVILSPAGPQTIAKTIVSGPSHSPPVHGEVYDSIQMLL